MMDTNAIIGLDSAYICAQETGSGNMQISAGLVVELIDRLRAAETERQELRHAQNSLFDRLSDLTAYKEAAENQKPVQWVCELSSNPWPDGGGTRRDTKEDALKYINSDSNHCKYDTVSPIYRLPVQAEKPAVAVPDVNYLASTLMDAWKFAEPSHGVTVNITSYVSTFVDMARAVINHHFESAPSHSQQGANAWRPIETAPKDGVEILICEANGDMHIAYGHHYGSQFEWAQFDGLNTYSPTHWMPKPPSADRCPSHESEEQ